MRHDDQPLGIHPFTLAQRLSRGLAAQAKSADDSDPDKAEFDFEPRTYAILDVAEGIFILIVKALWEVRAWL